MMAVLIFLMLHWYLSLFGQTFYLHRYSALKMFTMSPFWEKYFYIFTWVTQGSSYLNARAYAILHRMHHAYSDTEKDPHTPHFFKEVFTMMMHTKMYTMAYYMAHLKLKNDLIKIFQSIQKSIKLQIMLLQGYYSQGCIYYSMFILPLHGGCIYYYLSIF